MKIDDKSDGEQREFIFCSDGNGLYENTKKMFYFACRDE